jgi:hypothetical protein
VKGDNVHFPSSRGIGVFSLLRFFIIVNGVVEIEEEKEEEEEELEEEEGTDLALVPGIWDSSFVPKR